MKALLVVCFALFLVTGTGVAQEIGVPWDRGDFFHLELGPFTINMGRPWDLDISVRSAEAKEAPAETGRSLLIVRDVRVDGTYGDRDAIKIRE